MKIHASGKSQRGAAILTAMLTVVLVATMANAMLWQQWRGIEVEAAQRTRVQSVWILTGALDWSRMILSEDARQGGADHLAEPWSIPLAPARLSTFLAAKHGQALVGDGGNGEDAAFLSGQIEDLQARLNVTNLVANQQIDVPSLAIWTRLFKHLNLSESELQVMANNLLRSHDLAAKAGAQSDVARPLQPQSVADLRWIGLSERSLKTLQPFITLLPARTTVNLNTADPEVLVAAVDGLDMAGARSLVQERSRHHLVSLDNADKLIGKPGIKLDASLHGVSSQFFVATGKLRLGGVMLQEMSVLRRQGMNVQTLSRTHQVHSMPTTASL